VVAAAADGVLADIAVAAADQVTRGQRLATIEPST
jgi:multidrug efflux pump subunit AcrA (membrane-fusion protein)